MNFHNCSHSVMMKKSNTKSSIRKIVCSHSPTNETTVGSASLLRQSRKSLHHGWMLHLYWLIVVLYSRRLLLIPDWNGRTWPVSVSDHVGFEPCNFGMMISFVTIVASALARTTVYPSCAILEILSLNIMLSCLVRNRYDIIISYCSLSAGLTG